MRRSKSRQSGFREVRKRILIYCEGAVVEPTYFKSFQMSSVVVQVVPGSGGNHSLKFVQSAIRDRKNRVEQFDEYWLVFDKDGTSDDDFNRSVELAEKHHFIPAFSIQAFEYWFILHFKLWQGGLERSRYDDILTDLLGFEYEKTDTCIRKVCDHLYPLTETAIRHAKQVVQSFEPHRNLAKEESSTRVYQIVEQLMSYQNYAG